MQGEEEGGYRDGNEDFKRKTATSKGRVHIVHKKTQKVVFCNEDKGRVHAHLHKKVEKYGLLH